MASDVETLARSALSRSPISALRDLRVDREGDTLLISGCVRSFYHKQLAQEVIRAIAKDFHVVNAINVEY